MLYNFRSKLNTMSNYVLKEKNEKNHYSLIILNKKII